MRGILIRGLLLGVLLCLPALPARAETEAEGHYRKAQAHYQLGEWADAAKEYKEAFRLQPVPGLLFNLAQTYRMAKSWKDAAFFYGQFLKTAPADDPNRGLATELLAECEKSLAAKAAVKPRPPTPDKERPPPATRQDAAVAQGPETPAVSGTEDAAAAAEVEPSMADQAMELARRSSAEKETPPPETTAPVEGERIVGVTRRPRGEGDEAGAKAPGAAAEEKTELIVRAGLGPFTGIAGVGAEVRRGLYGIAFGTGRYAACAGFSLGPGEGWYVNLHLAWSRALIGSPLPPGVGVGVTGGYELRPVPWLSVKAGAGLAWNSADRQRTSSLPIVLDLAAGPVF